MRCALMVLVGAAVLAAAQPEVKEFRKTVPLKPDALLSIESGPGSLEITGSDQPNAEIYAKIEMQPEMFKSKYAVQDTQIKVTESGGDTVQIRADFSKIQQSSWSMFTGGSVRPDVHFKIRMPRTARVRITAHRADTRVQDMRGEIELETSRATVKMNGIAGPVRLRAMRADVELRAASPAGPSRIESFRGTVQVFLPAKAKFSIEPDGRDNSGVTNDFGKTPAETVEGLAKVNGGGPIYRVTSHRGSVAFKKL